MDCNKNRIKGIPFVIVDEGPTTYYYCKEHTCNIEYCNINALNTYPKDFKTGYKRKKRSHCLEHSHLLTPDEVKGANTNNNEIILKQLKKMKK